MNDYSLENDGRCLILAVLAIVGSGTLSALIPDSMSGAGGYFVALLLLFGPLFAFFVYCAVSLTECD